MFSTKSLTLLKAAIVPLRLSEYDSFACNYKYPTIRKHCKCPNIDTL